MIEQVFNKLAEANVDRVLAYDDTKEALYQEESYLRHIKKYVENSSFLDETMDLLQKKNATIPTDALIEAYTVILYSDNTTFKDTVLDLALQNTLPLEKVLSRLPKNKQKENIEKLILKNNKKAFTFAGKCMVVNGYKEFVPYFYNDDGIVDTDDNVAYSVLCRLGGDKEKNIVETLFSNTSHPIKKEMIALELIHAKSHMAREFIKEFQSIDSFAVFPFISAREDMALYRNELMERLADGELAFLEAYSKITVWYGNPRFIPFYIEMLENIDVCMQFNELLLRFFYYDENMEPLEEVMEKWDEYKEKIDDEYSDNDEKYDELFEVESKRVQAYIIDFWKSQKSYIDETIDMDKKYYIDEHFNILEIWEDSVEDFWDKQMNTLYKGIQLLTGNNFAFDTDGLRSRQLKQSKVIEQYLKEHDETFKIGNWFIWGETSRS